MAGPEDLGHQGNAQASPSKWFLGKLFNNSHRRAQGSWEFLDDLQQGIGVWHG